jgi:phenylacetate-CoA ligase
MTHEANGRGGSDPGADGFAPMPRLMKLYEKLERRSVSTHYEEFKRNERASLARLEEIQLDKLRRLVEHAHDTVPFYAERFRAAGFRPRDLRSLDDLKRLPLVAKQDLKTDFDRLVSTACDRSRLVAYATGGSTGQPTRFLLTPEQYDARAAVEAKSYQMAGWDFLCKSLILSSAPVDASLLARWKEEVKSRLLRRRRIATFDVTERKLRSIHGLIERQRPDVVFGYVS